MPPLQIIKKLRARLLDQPKVRFLPTKPFVQEGRLPEMIVLGGRHTAQLAIEPNKVDRNVRISVVSKTDEISEPVRQVPDRLSWGVLTPRRWRLMAIVLFVLTASPVAHASQTLSWPDYMGRIWFRIGITSDRRFSFGIAGDLIPASAGIEFSPRSELGLVRVFVVAKGGYPPPQSCSVFVGGSAGAVAAFGPGQPLHFGLRLGAHVEHTPMADAASPNSSSARLAEELSYRFSWLRGAGGLHDGGIALGAHWAPGGYCQTD